VQRQLGGRRPMKSILTLTVNGRKREDLVTDGLLLVDYLREVVGLTGTKRGCDGGECGACTVLVDDQPRLACSTLAVQMHGRRGETIEGLPRAGRLNRPASPEPARTAPFWDSPYSIAGLAGCSPSRGCRAPR